MQRTIVQPADFTGAALAELKHWLGITRSDEDQQILGLLEASHELCEAFTGQAPLEEEVEEILPASSTWQRLSIRPVRAITQVTAISLAGERSVLDVEAYQIDIDAAGIGCIRASTGVETRRLAVRALAGISPDWEQLPDALRHGIIRLSAHYYRDRDLLQPAAPPASIAALWRPWRLVRL